MDRTAVSKMKYEKLLDGYLTVNFRKYAYERLNLTEDEIIALDPLYLSYMQEKNELNDRREKLVKDYRKEMKEDDRPADEAEETTDFIEDYWELKIAGEELRKDYFDKMEDVIPYQKAFTFFLLEESIEMDLLKEMNVQLAPVLLELEDPNLVYYRELKRYNIWMQRNNIDIGGTVSLDHQYTYDGLKKLSNAIRATARVAKVNVTDLEARIDEIMAKAAQMQEDKYADTHADLAKAAFMMVTDLMTDLNRSDAIVIQEDNIKQMRAITDKIDTNKL